MDSCFWIGFLLHNDSYYRLSDQWREIGSILILVGFMAFVARRIENPNVEHCRNVSALVPAFSQKMRKLGERYVRVLCFPALLIVPVIVLPKSDLKYGFVFFALIALLISYALEFRLLWYERRLIGTVGGIVLFICTLPKLVTIPLGVRFTLAVAGVLSSIFLIPRVFKARGYTGVTPPLSGKLTISNH